MPMRFTRFIDYVTSRVGDFDRSSGSRSVSVLIVIGFVTHARLRLAEQLLNRCSRTPSRGGKGSRPASIAGSQPHLSRRLLMELTLLGLPITVALAAVAVLGYWIGRCQRPRRAADLRCYPPRAEAGPGDRPRPGEDRPARSAANWPCTTPAWPLSSAASASCRKAPTRPTGDCCATKPSGCSSRRRTWPCNWPTPTTASASRAAG